MKSIAGRIEPRGPFLNVTAMASSPHVDQLKKLRRPAPQPLGVLALIDTGASGCVLDFGVVARLGLIPTGKAPVHTPTSGPNYVMLEQYDVSLFFGSQPGEVASFTVSVFGADLASEGFLAIIGWDVLMKCVLVCDGPAKSFRLDF